MDDSETAVEPVLQDEPEMINRDFVNMSGEVYTALEASRWFGDIHPIKISEQQLTAHFVK